MSFKIADLNEKLRSYNFFKKIQIFNTLIDFFAHIYHILIVIILLYTAFGIYISKNRLPQPLKNLDTEKLAITTLSLLFTGFLIRRWRYQSKENKRSLYSLSNPYIFIEEDQSVFKIKNKTEYLRDDTITIKALSDGITSYNFSFFWTGSGEPNVSIDKKESSKSVRKITCEKDDFNCYVCSVSFDPLSKNKPIKIKLHFDLPDPQMEMEPYLAKSFTKSRGYGLAKIKLIFSSNPIKEVSRKICDVYTRNLIEDLHEIPQKDRDEGVTEWVIKDIDMKAVCIIEWRWE